VAGFDLLLNTPLTIDTATFDLNRDGLADMKATLVG
jgi:hypothetical protein